MDKKEEEEAEEERVEKTLQMSEISLILDTYDDIFSDFDPRPYHQRALSVDFLEEAERASKDKSPEFLEMNFLIPQHMREPSKENTIKKRLKDHFKRHCQELEKERKRVIWKGLSFTLVGIILMIITTFILFKYRESTPTATFLVILFEPASWFLFWEGLNQAMFESKKISPKLAFYKKMQNCAVNFFTY